MTSAYYRTIIEQFDTSVLPIKANSKEYDMAALRQRGYRTLSAAKERRTKAPDIIAWWDNGTRKEETRNVALVTTSHLLIVDFDNEESYRRFYDDYTVFAHTLTVKTPRGYHLYYDVTEPISQDIISTWPKVELFHNGGVVLCPPSQIDGIEYEYVDNGLMSNSVMLTISRADVLPMVEKRERTNGFSSFRVPSALDCPPKAKLYKGVITDIKQRLSCLDLASRYTDMQDRGTYHLGCCPGHDDAHPSFRVAGGRAVCAVQSCKLYDARALDVIELHSRLCGLSYRDSIAILAKELGLVE